MNFDRLVQHHKDAIYRQLYRLCGNHEDAEDVLVESLLAAHRSLGDLQHEQAFHSWLGRIAARSCVRLKHKEKLRPLVPLEGVPEPADPSEGPEGALLRQEVKSCLLDAYNSLPPIYQQVYRLRDVEELSGEETADRLGIPLRAMKSRLHRARKLLRDRCDAAFQVSES